MGGMGAANGLRPRLGQAKPAHLARIHQPLHGADGIFDRHLVINPVLEIVVDHIDL